MQDIQLNEIEWYLRDYLFRQFNQGKQQFKKESLGIEMISLYLRFRNSNLEHLNDLINVVVEHLVSHKVLNRTKNNFLEMIDKFSRLQCSNCFYISYLNKNEPRNCLRCSSTELYDFPKKR